MSDHVYDLSLKSETFKIKNSKGEVFEYELRELTGAGRDKHLSDISKNVTVGEDGKKRISSFAGLHISLLAQSVYRDDKPEKRSVIEKWPARVLEDLYLRATKLSAVEDEDAQVEVGND